MSRARKSKARPKAVTNAALLRRLQTSTAIARCIRLAAEHGEDDALDLADAIAALVILLEGAAALLDQPEGAT